MQCKDGKCDVASRIAAARAGRARGTGSAIPMDQRVLAREFETTLPPASSQGGVGIGIIALAVLAVILMRK